MEEAITINANKPNLIKNQANRLLKLHGYYDSYNPHHVRVWLIHTEVYFSFLAIGSSEQEALDNLADSGLIDFAKMSEEDITEYEKNGWDDSYTRLGNASEAFWSEHLYITEALAND